MKRVTILVTHLLGSGHLSRALILARALAEAGFRAQVVSGGMPTPHLDTSGVDFVQLPGVRSEGTFFTRLLDGNGHPVTEDYLRQRIVRTIAALRSFSPDVLVTELFPFGRRVLRTEFEAALAAAAELPRPPLVFASIRDILAPPSSPKKAVQTESWLKQHYDGVLVHSDSGVLPLEASWPVTPAVAKLLHYTGFMAAPVPAADAHCRDGEGEILVTAGGGPVGRRLFEASVAAAALGSGRRWRVLVGGLDAAEVCARLNAAAANAPVIAQPARADYRCLLARCAAAVGQCGYNTAIDWLQAGVPGVFVPFAEGGEVEQTLRAGSLRDRYGYECIAEDDLTPQKLADAAERAAARGRLSITGLKLDGAAESSRILLHALAERA